MAAPIHHLSLKHIHLLLLAVAALPRSLRLLPVLQSCGFRWMRGISTPRGHIALLHAFVFYSGKHFRRRRHGDGSMDNKSAYDDIFGPVIHSAG